MQLMTEDTSQLQLPETFVKLPVPMPPSLPGMLPGISEARFFGNCQN